LPDRLWHSVMAGFGTRLALSHPFRVFRLPPAARDGQ
jgi:hypothetical protein